MKKYFSQVLVTSMFLFTHTSIAQSDTLAQTESLKSDKDFHHFISISPLAIFSGVLRADYEYIFSDKRYGIVVTGMTGGITQQENDISFMRYVSGIEIGNKLYSEKINDLKKAGTSFYFNLGLRYQHLSFEYEGNAWRTVADDSTGLSLYRLIKTKLKPESHRFSIAPQAGFVLKSHRFMVDFYFGATRYVEFIKGNEENVELPLNNWNELGMRNMTLFTGIKLGMLF